MKLTQLTPKQSGIVNTAQLGTLLQKSKANTSATVAYSLKHNNNHVLHRLKKGLYLLGNENAYLIANKLYTPSYLSLETAMNVYSIIPDRTNIYTSITTKNTRSFSNNIAFFNYRHLKPSLFFGFYYHEGVFWAEPEKALLDYLYLNMAKIKVSVAEMRAFARNPKNIPPHVITYLQSERFGLEEIDFKKLWEYAEKFGKKKLDLIVKALEQI